MATVTRSTAPQPKAKESPGRFDKKSFDNHRIRSTSVKLLREGLNQFQLKLNAKLIRDIQSGFEGWLEAECREIASQIKTIPEHARAVWLRDRIAYNDQRRPENQPLRLLTEYLFQRVQQLAGHLSHLKSSHVSFRKAFSQLKSEAEREELILKYAAELGSRGSELRRDQRAFKRWFDVEAVTDRYFKLIGENELQLSFVLDRLGQVIHRVFVLSYKYHDEETKTLGNTDEQSRREALRQRLSGIWNRLNIEARIHDVLVYDGDSRVHVAALECLAATLSHLPDDLAVDLLDPRTLIFIKRASMENKSDVWIQCAALSILDSLSFAQTYPILIDRIEHPDFGDDFFVRRHALKLIEKRLIRQLKKGRNRDIGLPSMEIEESPFVRQKLAKVAFLSTAASATETWEHLVHDDAVPQVRAAAILAGIEVPLDNRETLNYLETVVECLRREHDPFVLRTAMHCLKTMVNSRGSEALEKQSGTTSDGTDVVLDFIGAEILLPLEQLQTTHEDLRVRRWAAQTREQIWAARDGEALQVIKSLKPRLDATAPGESYHDFAHLMRGVTEEKVGRILAVIAQDDFGYDFYRGWLRDSVLRGPSFGMRLWRLIYEFRNTATDKRQGIRHTIGRISTATTRAPSQILGELSQTKVPGEPLTIAEEQGWRPFLPLPDDFVSILNMSWFGTQTVQFYTAEGVTRVRGPKTLRKRLRAAWALNFRFAKFASARNWTHGRANPSDYVEQMRKLGFEIAFRPHSSSDACDREKPCETEVTPAVDPSVTRFFGAAAGLSTIPFLMAEGFGNSVRKLLHRFSDYFVSAFENSLDELVIFAAAVLLLVVGKHIYANFRYRTARRKIPLSIGGWGTRGKSGTERLKAALLGEMGHGLVSKTTGCEAMFIHANAFGDPLEIPLFRPYDKATIWEQKNLIELSSKMNPSVFLWECMALTPSYVDVLQRQWTCDDMGTITNTYPDHEDVQGPAGYNVAQTISGFVPTKSHLISTEEVMRPYVTDSCRSVGTTFRGLGWLESGLITDDVIERFPYTEHPDNIALVAAMGDELGCEYEYCLKAMADALIPDLGVLKTHPVAEVAGRKIEFTNGCSANERFGCMGNWKRLGFDQQDPWKEQGTWICGVVNNRADRVPRSKVFAKIMVDDLSADRFILIGTNLKGLQGFIEEAWREKEATLSLRGEQDLWDRETAVRILDDAAFEFRQPIDWSMLNNRVEKMLEASDHPLSVATKIDETTDIKQLTKQLANQGATQSFLNSFQSFSTEWRDALLEYLELKNAILNANQANCESVNAQFRKILKRWHQRKFIVVADADATGEEIVAQLVESTPPGFLNRAMGLQNIKGTGLDFVYRFQAWDICYEACEEASTNHPGNVEKAMQTLISMPGIGLLCRSRIATLLKHARQHPLFNRPELNPLLIQLENAFEDTSPRADSSEDEANTKTNTPKETRSQLYRWLLDSAEQYLDVNDSVRRRHLADRLYRDLAAQRISRQRAVLELRKLNKRQKGGWFSGK